MTACRVGATRGVLRHRGPDTGTNRRGWDSTSTYTASISELGSRPDRRRSHWGSPRAGDCSGRRAASRPRVGLGGAAVVACACSHSSMRWTASMVQTINAWYSGKHRAPAGICRRSCDQTDYRSGCRMCWPGRHHDITCARAVGALYWSAFQLDLPALADSGYQGAGQASSRPDPLARRRPGSAATHHRQSEKNRRPRHGRARPYPHRESSAPHFLLRSLQWAIPSPAWLAVGYAAAADRQLAADRR
jgi:hypothetical protein